MALITKNTDIDNESFGANNKNIDFDNEMG